MGAEANAKSQIGPRNREEVRVEKEADEAMDVEEVEENRTFAAWFRIGMTPNLQFSTSQNKKDS